MKGFPISPRPPARVGEMGKAAVAIFVAEVVETDRPA
jgi:hypothetical protein